MNASLTQRRAFHPTIDTLERREVLSSANLSLVGMSHIIAPPNAQTSSVAIATRQVAIESIRIAPNPFKNLEYLEVSKLKPGDIIISTESAAESWAIRKLTSSAYSHAALYIGKGQIIDATAKRVKVRPLAELMRDASRVGVIRVKNLTDAQQKATLKSAAAKVGRPYNYVALGLNGIAKLFGYVTMPWVSVVADSYLKGRLLAIGPGYFCSELVIRSFRSAGVSIAPTNGDTPGGIIDYALDNRNRFDFIGRLRAGK
jgi:hypothetical protein